MKNASVRKFQIQITDEEISGLQNRLRNTRWPSPVSASNWQDGTDGEYLRELVDYWANTYNWRERETYLNTFNHFQTDIEGTTLHFIKAAGQGPNPIPLLLMHGWPSSFVQLLEIIPLLTPHFEVIIASMPGYPFSSFPTEPGMSFERMAVLIKQLMVDVLGYEKFAARGSDQGGLVQQQIGLQYPQHLIGLHRHGISPFMNPLPTDLTDAEKAYQQKVAAWAPVETVYARLHGLRPETLTPALADSPVALASWIIEKFQRWGHYEGTVDEHFGRDKLLDNLSLHWFTGSGAASIRTYREALRALGAAGKVEVPTAIMMPLHDGVNIPAPREWAERTFNVQRFTIMEAGGHFPEWEVPELVADDVIGFIDQLR